MNIWKPFDTIGNWLLEELDAYVQLRIGVILVLLSIPLFVVGFFLNEPFFVYQMSAAALFLNGISIVVGAQVLVKAEQGKE